MIWCHCRACLCESYEASASEEKTLASSCRFWCCCWCCWCCWCPGPACRTPWARLWDPIGPPSGDLPAGSPACETIWSCLLDPLGLPLGPTGPACGSPWASNTNSVLAHTERSSGLADAAPLHRRPLGPALTRSYRVPPRPAFAGGVIPHPSSPLAQQVLRQTPDRLPTGASLARWACRRRRGHE